MLFLILMVFDLFNLLKYMYLAAYSLESFVLFFSLFECV